MEEKDGDVSIQYNESLFEDFVKLHVHNSEQPDCVSLNFLQLFPLLVCFEYSS